MDAKAVTLELEAARGLRYSKKIVFTDRIGVILEKRLLMKL